MRKKKISWLISNVFISDCCLFQAVFEVHYSIVERGCPYKEFVDIIGLAKQHEVYFPLMVYMKIRVPAEVLLT